MQNTVFRARRCKTLEYKPSSLSCQFRYGILTRLIAYNWRAFFGSGKLNYIFCIDENRFRELISTQSKMIHMVSLFTESRREN